MEFYKQGPGPDFSRKDWLDKKYSLGLDFPNLPYLIDGDLRISESVNICNYLMAKYVPQLLGKTQGDKAKVQETLSFLGDLKNGITRPCYDQDKSKAPAAVEGLVNKFELLEKKLGDNEWLVGDEPTVCDLFLMEITDQVQMITKGAWLKENPFLEAHNERTKAIPSIKDYKNSSRFHEGPFNNPVATTNNVPADYWKWARFWFINPPKLNFPSVLFISLSLLSERSLLSRVRRRIRSSRLIYKYYNLMEEKGPLIGYWKIRGLGELVKLIMEYGKKPY